MGRRILYCLLIAVVCLTSCSRRDRVIPRGKMAKIYAEMFIADQRILGQTPSIRSMADTSLVYEPIFEKYGYTSDDYRASVAYYIKDANRFARILRNTGVIIENDIRALKKEKRLLELLGDADMRMNDYVPEKIFYMTSIRNPNTMGADTLIYFLDANGGNELFEPRDWESPAFYGPERVMKNVQRRTIGEKLTSGKKVYGKSSSVTPVVWPLQYADKTGNVSKNRKSKEVEPQDETGSAPAEKRSKKAKPATPARKDGK